MMNKYHRDIILVVNDGSIHPDAIDMRVESMHEIISLVDHADGFCSVHELVNRNHITSKRSRILQAAQYETLRPFRFLLNKN